LEPIDDEKESLLPTSSKWLIIFSLFAGVFAKPIDSKFLWIKQKRLQLA